MRKTISSGIRYGMVRIPSSKSQLHRLLICAALSRAESHIICDGISQDIEATINCLSALGARISISDEKHREDIHVIPIDVGALPDDETCELYCKESGSTLRFLIPLVGALGRKAVFHMEGRLSERPLAPFDEQLEAHGMHIRREGDLLYCDGQLGSGTYTLPGDVSSQYITALLLALPLLSGDSRIEIVGNMESVGYIEMTLDALEMSDIQIVQGPCGSMPHLGCEGAEAIQTIESVGCDKCTSDEKSTIQRDEKRPSEQCYIIKGDQNYHLPQTMEAQGDFSNAAFFMCMGALSDREICIEGLNLDSHQGDRQIIDILRRMGADIQMFVLEEKDTSESRSHDECTVGFDGLVESTIYSAESDTDDKKGDRIKLSRDILLVRYKELKGIELDATQIPDLVPAIAMTAALASGRTIIKNASRLRLKESDRIVSTVHMINALGGKAVETSDGMIIDGRDRLAGGIVDSYGDHRIAMAASIAVARCDGDVIIEGAEAVAKSYPRYWDDFERLWVLK